MVFLVLLVDLKSNKIFIVRYFLPKKKFNQTMTEQIHYRDEYAMELLIRRSILLHVDMQFFPLLLSCYPIQNHSHTTRKIEEIRMRWKNSRFLLLQNFIPGRKRWANRRWDHVWHSPDEEFDTGLPYLTQIRLLLSLLEHRISVKFRSLRRCFAFFRPLERA